MKTADLYRMKMKDHICPFGTKAKYLLQSQGFNVDDHHLRTREETDAFKEKHQVSTTPQIFIDGKRIGGYDDLRVYLGKRPAPKKGQVTYAPVISLFGIALLMSLAIQWMQTQSLGLQHSIALFGGLSMCLLALLKFRDSESFANGFLNYDLLSQRFVPYAYAYPYAELLAGLGMLSGLFPYLTAAVAIFVGVEGAISVLKAVAIEKRELKCACVGGDSNVPLGFISFSENALMIAMGLWMLARG